MISLESVFAGQGFADTAASALQRAICRVAEARPLDGVLSPDECLSYFGCAEQELGHQLARRVVLIAGVRGGKSLLSCCQAIAACLTADLSTLRAFDLPRYAIVGPTVDAARATFVQLTGILQSSRVLRTFLDGEPTADTVVIRRPDGRRVEIVVVAAHRGGLSVRNRWLVGCTLEEVASFGSETTGAVVNAEEIMRAAETRLLPGCQAWLISSPFGPVGLLHDLYARHFGRPGTTLVVHAPTRALNPSFPQSRIDEIRRESPDVAAREYDAAWVDADSAFLAATLVDAATRAEPLIRPGRAFTAAMDPATRGNAWTLAVSWSELLEARDRYGVVDDAETVTRVIVAGVWQWHGSKAAPLSPRETLRQIAAELEPFGVSSIYTDGWALDALQDHAQAAGLTLQQHTGDRDAPYTTLRTLLANGLIELPPHELMRQDLLSIRQRATSSGIKIMLPKTADGRHCDFAPAVALAAHHAEAQRGSEHIGTAFGIPSARAAGDHRFSRSSGSDPWLKSLLGKKY
jgi:hypothetical protein